MYSTTIESMQRVFDVIMFDQEPSMAALDGPNLGTAIVVAVPSNCALHPTDPIVSVTLAVMCEFVLSEYYVFASDYCKPLIPDEMCLK